MHNINPNVFGQSNISIEPTNKVGDDTRAFSGVDMTFNVRTVHSFTFSGGTSTGKVVNDWTVRDSRGRSGELPAQSVLSHGVSVPDVAPFPGRLHRSADRRASQLGVSGQADRIRQLDFTVKKIVPLAGRRLTVGLDIYNVMNNNVTLAFNGTFVPAVAGWNAPTSYRNLRVFRLNAEFPW